MVIRLATGHTVPNVQKQKLIEDQNYFEVGHRLAARGPCVQCDHIWQNFATLANILKSLAVFCSISLYLAIF